MDIENNNLYITGFITKFQDGTQLLERKLIPNNPQPGDDSVVFKDTDSLLSIAKVKYGDCKNWFILADVNEILNPFDIDNGEIIKVPNLQRLQTLF